MFRFCLFRHSQIEFAIYDLDATKRGKSCSNPHFFIKKGFFPADFDMPPRVSWLLPADNPCLH